MDWTNRKQRVTKPTTEVTIQFLGLDRPGDCKHYEYRLTVTEEVPDTLIETCLTCGREVRYRRTASQVDFGRPRGAQSSTSTP